MSIEEEEVALRGVTGGSMGRRVILVSVFQMNKGGGSFNSLIFRDSFPDETVFFIKLNFATARFVAPIYCTD
jgi:hypothetical protein